MNPVRVSVNFSKLHFKEDNFADRILEIIHRQGIPAKCIEIELTEASGFENFENFVEFTKIMRNNGIEVSIDDFGTGYSSLNVLKRMNVDIIKLDKSFIDTIENKDEQDDVFLKNIVNMINELGMRVVAEGVETNTQVEFLKKVDCSAVQGYYYDRPMPRERFEERLLEKRVY
jgi:EAL domain-containing protein (putative c-di-GMP-specific phosphodiesterase class I)